MRVGDISLDLLYLSEHELERSREQGDDGALVLRTGSRLHLRVETLFSRRGVRGGKGQWTFTGLVEPEITIV